MDRRGFLKGGALAAVTAALKPPASGAREHQREFLCKTHSWPGICSPQPMASEVSLLKTAYRAGALHCKLRMSSG